MGRHPKDKLELLEELTDKVNELNWSMQALSKGVEVLASRWNYWLKKEAEKEKELRRIKKTKNPLFA